MNGVHDMGGMHGFGPVPIENNEPVFHADWEARAFAITLAMSGWKRWNLDSMRRAREQMHPAAYLNHSYYERWIDALERMMVETGLVEEEELASGEASSVVSSAEGEPLDAAGAQAMLHKGGPSARSISHAPIFAAGDDVRALNLHPVGHTRMPRYVRGHKGVVVRHQGAHVLPDSNAHFEGEKPEHLYAVRFSAHVLWGPKASAVDTVTIDMWESYLEAV